ncbi:MAG: helix-hairpin-helix domain-containing protein [Candidatus Marinimicrobia bacterium]|nr:helix-hairpin-helix domain-containing protein [Candidatus Neomarinimicrobiota bacterium]
MISRNKHFSVLFALAFWASFTGNINAQDSTSVIIDLNNASEQEINQLPATPTQLKDLIDYRLYVGNFQSVYDLLKIESIDYETFIKIKPLVRISPTILEESGKRIEDNYYKVEQWISNEGASESYVDEWIDRLSNPVNVNEIGMFDLLNLSSVSPVDAVAVMNRQKLGEIKNRNDLRNTDNLSYYGFSGLEDFIRYDEPATKERFGGSYTTVIKNITLSQTPSDDATSFLEFKSRNVPLDTYHKLRLHWGNDLKFEISTMRNLGEPTIEKSWTKADLPEIKSFFEIRNLSLLGIHLNQIIVGDYMASFGQGVTMESTDFFMSRKTGYGFRKRVNGISGDISRTMEYGLRGAAVEAEWKKLLGAGFISLKDRDAVVNDDGSFSTFITMYPRLNYGLYDSIPNPMIKSVKELLFGGNVKYSIFPGTYIGGTIYHSYYNRVLDPQIKATLLNSSGRGKYMTQIGNSADSEIEASYSSDWSSDFLKNARSQRRIYGLEFMSVIKNMSFQGEFAQLDKNEKLTDVKDDPKAYVLSGYIQFDNFNFLLLYRNYDLEFDNPYQRSFSNYQRFKGTIYEDSYYLKDPVLGYLYSGTAQPQAEKGLYYSTRYQISRSLVATVEQDIWQRVADKAQFSRMVAQIDYRPVFKLRFRIRQKWQNRDKTNELTSSYYQANETRLQAIMRLSRYDQVSILYAINFTQFVPRSRLVYSADDLGTSYVGNAGSPGKALGMTVTHNVNERIKLIGSLMTYQGFLWNFEDTDFRVFSTDTQSLHGWLTVFSRLSQNISLRMKYSFDLHEPMTNIIDGRNEVIGVTDTDYYPTVDDPNTQTFYSDFRIQLDYRF